VRDGHARTVLLLRLMEESRIEIEAVRLDAEGRIGDAALADQDDLLAAAERLDGVRPFLESGVVRRERSPN